MCRIIYTKTYVKPNCDTLSESSSTISQAMKNYEIVLQADVT